MLEPVEYLTIGHVTHDVLPDHSLTIGGTVSYAALTAAALQRSVGVLTSAGPDFDLSVFDGVVTVACAPATATTTFENIYTNGHRHQLVYEMASPLGPSAIPPVWRQPAVAHIGPVIGECERDLVLCFPETTFVGITPQGWMRSRDHSGHVHSHPWEDPAPLLACASAVVFSIDDVQGDWVLARSYASYARLLVVTTGAGGGVLFVAGEATPFPALEVAVVDPTGAGDIFAAVFFSALASGTAPEEAARFAACLASRSVMRVGLAGVPGPVDLAFCRDSLAQHS